MKLLRYCIVALFLAPSLSFTQLSSPTLRDNTLPDPSSFTWESERELLVLIDQASNRIAVANLIRDAAHLNSSLSQSQKIDGFEISGHSLYSDKSLDNSLLAFQLLLDLPALDSPTRSSTLRMIGQIRYLKGEYDLAYNSYSEAYQLDQTLLLNGEPSSLGLLAPMYAHVTSRLGRAAEATQILDTSILLLESTSIVSQGYFIPKMLEQASNIAELDGNSPLAIMYIDRLINEYPSYGNDDPELSIPVNLRLRKLTLSGENIEILNANTSAFAEEILLDPNHKQMPLRFSIGESFARNLEKKTKFGGPQAASHLRNMLIMDADDILSNLSDPIHINLITKAKARTVIDEANLLILQGSINDAQILLNEIILELSDGYPELTNKAQTMLSVIPAP